VRVEELREFVNVGVHRPKAVRDFPLVFGFQVEANRGLSSHH
jgi:hypothetical protein